MAITMRPLGRAAMLLGMMHLAACQKPAETPTNGTAADGSATATVTRETTPPVEEPPVAPMAAPTVIQSQPGPDGSQVDLLKVAVTGDILTVTLRCSSSEKFNSTAFGLKDISVIDDATSQRIAVLKDNAGEWLASNVAGDNIIADCTLKPGIIWAKFAAPSAGAKTVSINFPKVAPFDGVPVAR